MTFKLSERIIESKFMRSIQYGDNKILMVGDVKEFIKLLKEEFCICKYKVYHRQGSCKVCKDLERLSGFEIDKLSGDLK